MELRARFQAWRRLPSGSHLPHPAISTLASVRDVVDVRAPAHRLHRRRATRLDAHHAGYGRSRRLPPVSLSTWRRSTPWTPGSSTSHPAPTAGADDRPDPVAAPTTCACGGRERAEPHGSVGHTGMPKPPLPHVPGCDVAGSSTRSARGHHVSVGDEVVVNPGVSPVEDVTVYVAEEFTATRPTSSGGTSRTSTARCSPLVNLPEVVKGALFARYSRSQEPAPAVPRRVRRRARHQRRPDDRRHRRPASGPRSSTTGCSSSTATTRSPSSAACTWPASRPRTCSPRCSSGAGS
jgi:hypothetical protein